MKRLWYRGHHILPMPELISPGWVARAMIRMNREGEATTICLRNRCMLLQSFEEAIEHSRTLAKEFLDRAMPGAVPSSGENDSALM